MTFFSCHGAGVATPKAVWWVCLSELCDMDFVVLVACVLRGFDDLRTVFPSAFPRQVNLIANLWGVLSRL